MKVEVAKDVLYYLAMNSTDGGGERDRTIGPSMVLRVSEAARRIKAAAILGPIEIIVT